ncbi:hypothetical protein N2152v2_002823 [Parachlorella kessleri]
MLRSLAASLGPALRWEVPLLTRGVKSTTGIAREHLREKYGAVLDALNVIPSTAEYRLAVEKTVNYKLEILNSDVVDEEVEDKLGRQLEEEIRMCDDELKLIPKMAEWKPWDVPEGHTVEVIEEQDVEHKMATK